MRVWKDMLFMIQGVRKNFMEMVILDYFRVVNRSVYFFFCDYEKLVIFYLFLLGDVVVVILYCCKI